MSLCAHTQARQTPCFRLSPILHRLGKVLMPLTLVCGMGVLGLLPTVSAQAQTSTRQVSLPNQDYRESTEDLSVKVLGGHVRINRDWTRGKWYLNARWSHLVFHPDPLGGVLAISRADTLYTRILGGSGIGGDSVVDGGADDEAHSTTASAATATAARPTSGTAGTRGNTAPPTIDIGTGVIRPGETYRFDEDNAIQATADPDEPAKVGGWQWYDRLGNSINYDLAGRILSYANAAGVRVSFEYDADERMTGVVDHHGTRVLGITYNATGQPVRISDNSGRSVSYQWQLPAGGVGSHKGSNGSIGLALLSEVTDVRGGSWRYQYNTAGYIEGRTDPAGGQISLTYLTQPERSSGVPTGSTGSTRVRLPASTRVASLTDESGATTHYRVDYHRVKREYLISRQLPDGVSQQLRYDRQGRLLQDTLDGVTRYLVSWDSPTRKQVTDGRGLVTLIQYDSARARRPVKTIHPDGSVESTTYDRVYTRKSRFTNALGVSYAWHYDAQGNLSRYIEAEGLPAQRTTRYTYDPYGQMLSRTRGAGEGQGSDAITVHFTYDRHGNLTGYTNGEGQSVSATYNVQGLPLSQSNALGQTITHSYDAAGNRIQSRDALDGVTQQAWDERSRRLSVSSAAGRTQAVAYDAAGRLLERRAPGQGAGEGLRLSYDSTGRPTRLISPGGLVTQISYDNQGRLSTLTDPADNTIRYTYGGSGDPLAGLLTGINYPTYSEHYGYDQRGRPTRLSRQFSTAGASTPTILTQSQAFDALGQRLATTDAAGNSTLYQYDALGRLIKTTDSLGNSSHQQWDAHDNLLALSDASGNLHRFSYDRAGRLIKETRPMGGAIHYHYDAAGQLVSKTGAGGNSLSYSYDAAGRLTAEEHTQSNGHTDQQISYRYNADGQLIAYEQQDGQGNLISRATYTLDEQGRTATSATTYATAGGGQFSFETGHRYNADDQLHSHTWPDGSQQTYHYSHGLLSQITLPDQSRISYSQYQWLRPGQISTPGTTTTLTYDGLQRLLGLEVSNSSGQSLSQRQYQYSSAGNITQLGSELGQTDYGYDRLNRLTQATPEAALQALGLPVERYTYDAVGNRTSSAHQSGIWHYNADNQLTQYPQTVPFSPAPFNQSPAIDTQINYSPQGHTLKESNSHTTRDYGYNAADRLTSYRRTAAGQGTPDLQANYQYDPFGRRIAKHVTEGGTTNTKSTYFIYSEQGLLGETDQDGGVCQQSCRVH
ncbi:MAG: hypothetical protein ACK5ME_12495 [Parahaliea sp.]